jgi:hypothetical protein
MAIPERPTHSPATPPVPPPEWEDNSDGDDEISEGTPVVHGAPGKPKLAQFVTPLKQIEQQIGEHVVAALQHEHTVAVLTTVVYGQGGQQNIVSAALDPQTMAQVQQLLQSASQTRVESEPCFGFHCLIEPKPGPSSNDHSPG